MDGTYEITDLNVTGAGKILKMKVNGKVVDVVTDITRNGDDKITAISINGTSQEIAGGGSSDIEENKEATIDVSAYTEPVEITPTAGKDGMKKVTVTLDNIPSGRVNAYCWGDNDIKVYTDFSSAPNSAPGEDYPILKVEDGLIEKTTWEDFGFTDYVYEKVDDSTIKLTSTDDPTDVLTFTRWSNNDFTLW